MEYLVHTSGEVAKYHNKTYVVNATSEQEANQIAQSEFSREFGCVNITSETKIFARTKRSLVSLGLILIAIIISLFTYVC